MPKINVAIIGAGAIAIANHVPGFETCSEARVVALCDANPEVLGRAQQQTGITIGSTDYRAILNRDDVSDVVSAVVIATPNHLHAPIAIAAARAGKHILCEKPIAMNLQDALEMLRAAEQAGVRHMTAFTYRFVPAMRYMIHLIQAGHIGQPYHFRASRFQDWGARGLAWRQIRRFAGTGEMGDMLSHRIDYAHVLVGPIGKLVADTRRFIDTRAGQPSDVDDWVALLVRFAQSPATGILESSKLATGRGEGARSHDWAEVNAEHGTLVYSLERPHVLLAGKPGGRSLEPMPVPEEFLKLPGAQRDPRSGDPLVGFRYDQDFEFCSAILENRPAVPGFAEGAAVQAVMDAALTSAAEQRWVDVPPITVRSPQIA